MLEGRPNQFDKLREDVHVTAERLLDVAATPGEVTEAGLRNNVSVGIQYLASWLHGTGAVVIFNLMEDTATAEISRSQVWQWLHNDIVLADTAQVVSRELVERIVDEEIAKLPGQTTRRRAPPSWTSRSPTTSPSFSPSRHTSGSPDAKNPSCCRGHADGEGADVGLRSVGGLVGLTGFDGVEDCVVVGSQAVPYAGPALFPGLRHGCHGGQDWHPHRLTYGAGYVRHQAVAACIGERHVEVRIELVERLPVELRFVHRHEPFPHTRKVLRLGVATGEDHAGSLERHPRVDDVLDRERPQGPCRRRSRARGVAGHAIERRTGVGTFADL